MNISIKKTLKYFLTLTVVLSLSSEFTGLVHEVLGHGLCAYLLGGSFDGYTTSDANTTLPLRAPFSHHILHRAAGIIVSVILGLPLFISGYRCAASKWYGLPLMLVGSALLLDNLGYLFINAIFPRPPGDFGWILTQWQVRELPAYSVLRYAGILVGGIGFFPLFYLTWYRLYAILPYRICKADTPSMGTYLVVALSMLLFAGDYAYGSDYNEVISDVGIAPNHILFAILSLILILLTARRYLTRSNTGRPTPHIRQDDGDCVYMVRSVFGLLCLLSLLLQMPWRVVVLATLVFFAVIAIPRRRHYTFWLAMGSVIIGLILWGLMPLDQEGWSTYDSDDAYATSQRQDIPDGENAAVLYDNVYESLMADFNDVEYEYLLHYFWTSKDYPELASWFADRQHWIDDLEAASRKVRCFYDSHLTGDNTSPFMEMASRFRRLHFFLICSANHELAEGRRDTALRQYTVSVGMARHLFQQSSTLPWLTGVACRSILSTRLKEAIFLNHLSVEEVTPILALMDEHDYQWRDVVLHDIQEEASSLEKAYASKYQLHETGKFRFNPGPEKPLKAKTLVNWFCLPHDPQVICDMIDRWVGEAETRLLDAGRYDWDRDLPMAGFASGLNFRSMIRRQFRQSVNSNLITYSAHLRCQVENKGLKIIVGLKRYRNRHGSWPEDLNGVADFVDDADLIDPSNGGPFLYRVEGDRFTLYSKGANGKDDDGETSIFSGVWQSSKDDWIIWPTRRFR